MQTKQWTIDPTGKIELEKLLREVKADVSAVKKELASLRSEVDGLRDDVRDLRDLSNFRAQQQKFNKDMKELMDRIEKGLGKQKT